MAIQPISGGSNGCSSHLHTVKVDCITTSELEISISYPPRYARLRLKVTINHLLEPKVYATMHQSNVNQAGNAHLGVTTQWIHRGAGKR